MEHPEDDGRIRPLQVPAAHHAQGSWRDRVVFALADIGEGTADDVAERLSALNDPDASPAAVRSELEQLFDQGLINGTDHAGQRAYNLAKETRPHRGRVDPDELDL